MPWNETTRKQHARNTGRYESDLTDAEWELLEPLLPPPSRRGRPRKVDLREVTNAILHLLATGGPWRSLPKDFPPLATVRNHFYRWSRSGLLDKIVADFTARERRRAGRPAAPSAAIIDSRSVTTVEACAETSGHDAGKKVKGRKRHLVVDTGGNPLVARVHPADVQDRDGAVPLLLALHTERKTGCLRTAPAAAGSWRRRWRRRTVR